MKVSLQDTALLIVDEMRGSITLVASHGIRFCGLSQGLNPVRSEASKLYYSLITFAEFFHD
jgi:hypothetical protein